MNFDSYDRTRSTVAIVGGGLSGSLVAANLLRHARVPLRIVIVERQPAVTRRVVPLPISPATSSDGLGAAPEGRRPVGEADHFVHWLKRHRRSLGLPASFDAGESLPREVFARYLDDVVAETGTTTPVIFSTIVGEAVDLEECGEGGGLLTLADGRVLHAAHVVLALGQLPGEYPIPRPLPIYRTRDYVHTPWQGNALEGLNPDDDLLLIGHGRIATDLIATLERAGHRGTVHALSRYGIPPLRQVRAAPWPTFLETESPPTSVRELMRKVRADVRDAAYAGSDWHAVVDGIRPHAQALWLALSWEERARFLRHVRSIWELHRHRISAEVAALLDRRVDSGRLTYHAGRVQTLDRDAQGVHALVRRRGSIQHLSLRVARVFNCTGPRTDYSKYQHPLFVHMLARGLIDHDPLALGINALPTGEVLRYRGGPIDWLSTLGPPLRGVLWESSELPEIRAQAKGLAEQISSRLLAFQPHCSG